LFGYGEFSDESSIQAATKPHHISVVSQVVVHTSVRVQWEAPYNNGSVIQYFSVFIRNAVGDMVEYTPCHTLEVICEVPMTTLIDSYGLIEDDLIFTQVTSTNAYGESETTSTENEVLVETVPHKPEFTPARGDLTT
jgi:predicted Zn-dependent protease